MEEEKKLRKQHSGPGEWGFQIRELYGWLIPMTLNPKTFLSPIHNSLHPSFVHYVLSSWTFISSFTNQA
jgi:hypothetical protein